MVKRYRESAMQTKKKKKKNYKKKLRKAYKKTRKATDTGVRIWKALNTQSNKKKMKSLGKRANTVSKNIMDLL